MWKVTKRFSKISKALSISGSNSFQQPMISFLSKRSLIFPEMILFTPLLYHLYKHTYLITYSNSTLILLFIAPLKLERYLRLKFFPIPCGLVSVLKSIRVFRKQYFSPQVLRVHPMFEVNSGLYIYGLSKWRVLAHFHEIRWKFDFLTAAVACQLTKETLSCVSTSAQTWG